MPTQLAQQTHQEPPQLSEAAPRPRASALRVMHVVNYLNYGGMEFGILKLIAGLGSAQFEHRFCTTRRFDPGFVRAYSLEDKLDVAAGSGSGLQFPLFRLRRIFRRYRPHIVHTRNWGALEAVPAARLAGVPVVIHSEHGYEVDTLAGLPLRQRLFRKMAYGMTDAVCAVTRELRDFHARQGWIAPDRIRVIYNGVDTERFTPNPSVRERVRGELGISPDTLLIGSVGRLVPIKDYATLLRAAEELRSQSIDLHVLLVGSGPELLPLQQQVAATDSLHGRVHFAGASDRVPELLQAMDAFVLPSKGEGMSNTLLEAMASALPVLATDVGGNPEVMGELEAGFLFRPGDVGRLAQLLSVLARNPQSRQTLGSTARHRVLTQFSLKAMISQYRDLYCGAAQRRGVAVQANGLG